MRNASATLALLVAFAVPAPVAVGAPVAAAEPSSLTLGGVAVGSSVLDAVKKFGTPNVVQTMDDGHFWQWAERDGLDREIITDDDLIVTAVLVARAEEVAAVDHKDRPPQGQPLRTTAQPVEAPLLGAKVDRAVTLVTSMGGVAEPRTDARVNVWRLLDGVFVAETDGSVIVRERACDAHYARQHGYLGVPGTPPGHRAPILVSQSIPEQLPAGSGTTIVLVKVDAAGKVAEARVIVSSGDRDVDAFELESMHRSTFRAATCGGAACPGVYLDVGGITRL